MCSACASTSQSEDVEHILHWAAPSVTLWVMGGRGGGAFLRPQQSGAADDCKGGFGALHGLAGSLDGITLSCLHRACAGGSFYCIYRARSYAQRNAHRQRPRTNEPLLISTSTSTSALAALAGAACRHIYYDGGT
eukprot:scaffold27268_cov110-Isochrysis_galbana.AAC.7